jgi:ABC-type nitrate/sulfonate/bicarbonate transport system substrate-binding protein
MCKRLPAPRSIGLVALVLALALASVACSDDSSSADGETGSVGDLQKVTLVLDWTPNTNHAGIYAADAEGYYADAGLDVDIIQPGENGSLPALGSGKADFAVSVQEQVIPARAEGVPVVSVAAILQHNTTSLLSLADTGVERPADLAGLRYGGYGGQLERELVESLVECDGGDPDDVSFVEVGNVDYRIGMEDGFYDFVWVFDGWDVIRLEEIDEVDVDTLPFIEYADCIPDWYTPLLATTDEVIDDDPDLVEAFVGATAKGYAYAIDHPAGAASILLDAAPELDTGLVEASMAYLASRYQADADQWGIQRESVWVDFEAFLRRSGLVTEPVDVTEAYTNDFVPVSGS